MAFLTLNTIFKYLDANSNSRCVVEGEQVLHARHIILCGRKSSNQGYDQISKLQIVGLCLQTSAVRSNPHQIEGEFSVKRNEVEVKSMKCSCKAGLSGTCKHVAAILLNCSRVDIEQLEILSSTDVECYWKKTKSEKNDIYNPSAIENYECLEKTRTKRKKIKLLRSEELNSCFNSILKSAPQCSLVRHRAGRTSVHYSTSTEQELNQEPLQDSRQDPMQLGDMAINNNESDSHLVSIIKFMEHCGNSEFLNELAQLMHIPETLLNQCCAEKFNTLKMCDLIEACNTKQRSQEWFNCKKFRVTGSICYFLYTYGIERKEEDWRKKTRNTVMGQNNGSNNKYTAYGIREEKNAMKVYRKQCPFVVRDDFGIVISKHFPWFGFSPDGVVFKEDAPYKLIEIKCPCIGETEPETSLTFITNCKFLKTTSNGIELKRKNPYYGQVQLGMALLNLTDCDFVIYSSFSKNFLKIEVLFDAEFVTNLIQSISEKYFQKMLHFFCRE